MIIFVLSLVVMTLFIYVTIHSSFEYWEDRVGALIVWLVIIGILIYKVINFVYFS